MPVALRLPDPNGTFAAVRLASDLPLSHEQRSFVRDGSDWVLLFEAPDVLRLEYKLELDYAGGGTDWVCDPGNPRRTPGAFGEKSVLELPGYVATCPDRSSLSSTSNLTTSTPSRTSSSSATAATTASSAGAIPRTPSGR